MSADGDEPRVWRGAASEGTPPRSQNIVPRLDDYWLYSKEHDQAWEDEQVDPRFFSATLGYRVRFDSDAHIDPIDYEVDIVSPAWIEAHQARGTILDGRHCLVLCEYNEHVVVSHVERKIAESSAVDASEVLLNLDRIGRVSPRRLGER